MERNREESGIVREKKGARVRTPVAPSRGSAVIFSSGWENMHEVETPRRHEAVT